MTKKEDWPSDTSGWKINICFFIKHRCTGGRGVYPSPPPPTGVRSKGTFHFRTPCRLFPHIMKKILDQNWICLKWFPSHPYTHLHLDFIEWINHGIQSIYIFKSSKKISFKVLFRTKVLRWERTFLGELFTTFQRPLRILDKNVQTFRHLHQNSYLKISILTISTFNIPTNYVAYII